MSGNSATKKKNIEMKNGKSDVNMGGKDGKLDEQIEKVLDKLTGASTPQEKLRKLAVNFLELDMEHNKQSLSIKGNEKQLDLVQREKDHLQKEYNKAILIRDKLEQVCREQQKLMKTIKSENLSKIRDEEEKRKETQKHFQTSINEIFATLEKNNDENTKLKETNIDMTKKFKYLAEQYELREKQLEKINEQMKLETELNGAKLAKAQMESTIEKEILLKEKEAILEELLSARKALIDLQSREKLLKEQLSLYTEKYEDFQTSLQKSNSIFTTYKSEIERMSKRIKSLEKESIEWRSKYEKTNLTVLNMVSDKQAQDRYVNKASRQTTQLQKLCRTLQAERSMFIQLLKDNNIDLPAVPTITIEVPAMIQPPVSRSSDTSKLDTMTRDCDEMKKALAQLQGQLSQLPGASDADKKSMTPTAVNGTNKKNKNRNKNKINCPTKKSNVSTIGGDQPVDILRKNIEEIDIKMELDDDKVDNNAVENIKENLLTEFVSTNDCCSNLIEETTVNAETVSVDCSNCPKNDDEITIDSESLHTDIPDGLEKCDKITMNANIVLTEDFV